jgi:hypothetical protein
LTRPLMGAPLFFTQKISQICYFLLDKYRKFAILGENGDRADARNRSRHFRRGRWELPIT